MRLCQLEMLQLGTAMRGERPCFARFSYLNNLGWHHEGTATSTREVCPLYLRLPRNGAGVFQGSKLGLTPVHNAAAKGNYRALQPLLLHAQDCVDIPSKTKETPLFFLHFGANTKAQNLRKQRPIDVTTSQDMCFILNSANVVLGKIIADISRY